MSHTSPAFNERNHEVSPFVKSFVALTYISVFTLTVILYLQYKKFVIPHLSPPSQHWPPMEEMRQNLNLLFQGFPDGYLRLILGIANFVLMSSFFLFSGKILLDWIFKKDDASEDGWDETGLLERMSLRYLLGALSASLIWFGFGFLGLLNSGLAYLTALGGFIGLWLQVYSSEWTRTSFVKKKFTTFLNHLTWTEKCVTTLVCFFTLCMALSTLSPMTGDTLNVVAALPNFYINEGRLLFNPYHFYTYFTQNTEMLVLWSLLLKSELAAGLVVWGFLSALTALTLGFFKRTLSYSAGLAAVLALYTVPLILSSLWIKADLPYSVFVFAHYITLIEALNRRSKRWVFLSGLLCGGAIGHKLVALSCALFTFLLLLGLELRNRLKNRHHVGLSIFWLLGCVAAVSPWLVRTGIETGDPIYPFLTNLLKHNMPDPIYSGFYTKSFSFNRGGLTGIVKYFFYLFWSDWSDRFAYSWGPTLLFGWLGILCFKKSEPVGFKLTFLSSLLSLCFFLRWLDSRFHLGMLMFLVSLPCALSWDTYWESGFKRTERIIPLSLLLSCVFLMWSVTGQWRNIYQNACILMSGNAPGNYGLMDTLADDMRWMHYIINTKSEDQGGVLYAGLYYIYGLKGRKQIFSSGYPDQLTREPLCDIAGKSKDSRELLARLQSAGVKHILMCSTFYNDAKIQQGTDPKEIDSDLTKIRDLLQKYAGLRFATPDRKVLWFSLKGKENLNPVLLTKEDALEYPWKYTQEAMARFKEGETGTSERMLQNVLHTPTSFAIKGFANAFLQHISHKR